MMRLRILAVSATLVMAGMTACGSAGVLTDRTTRVGTSTRSQAGDATKVSPVGARVEGRLLGDEDDDDTAEPATTMHGVDGDGDLDTDGPEARPFDHDDDRVRDFGYPVSIANARAVIAVMRRYYAAAVAENGAVGCAMLYRTYANSVVEDDGSSASPPYERGSTCAIVLSKIFAHLHNELSVPAKVVGVRVNGEMAYALLASARRPMSYFRLHREGARWALYGLIQRPLP